MFTSHFDKGDQVEVIKLDCCSYYPATVLRSSARHKNVVFVEYQTLFSSEENGSSRPAKCLREYVDIANLRPKIPHELILCFKAGDFVDAYCENAWDPGTIMDILEKSRYLVLFGGKRGRT
ncbi:Agenet domain containing protein [Quillaja saponaria]|uniref:Agenet domain containing protein n=1 Tax=Quillaja saponaria TaxID=32244 RepID=A0AAD7QFA8_QUISA|nr:Agenet domain containing protein [Quillaja saponaria]